MPAERNEGYDLVTEAIEKLEAAEPDVALHSTLWEAALEEMGTHRAEVAELQEQLTANSAKLSQMSTKHSKLTDNLRCAGLYNATRAIVLSNLKLIPGSFERPNKRAG